MKRLLFMAGQEGERRQAAGENALAAQRELKANT
jgi:hypothetical protein